MTFVVDLALNVKNLSVALPLDVIWIKCLCFCPYHWPVDQNTQKVFIKKKVPPKQRQQTKNNNNNNNNNKSPQKQNKTHTLFWWDSTTFWFLLFGHFPSNILWRPVLTQASFLFLMNIYAEQNPQNKCLGCTWSCPWTDIVVAVLLLW